MTNTFRINVQEPEKKDYQPTLDVHSIFSTIQGEGPFCGHPAVFVRLAGCNLQCPGCDTEYTQGRKRMNYHEILGHVLEQKTITFSSTKLIVITGGEPFRQDIGPFCAYLYSRGFKIQIETNGSMPVPPLLRRFTKDELENYDPKTMDWRGELNEEVTVVCSPKTAKLHPTVHERADCFKYVMRAGNKLESDGLPLQALEHRATPYIARPDKNFRGKIYLQPMDEQDEVINRQNVQAVLESAMKFNYIVQLQIHKLLEVE